MVPYLGNFAEDETIYIPWHSFDASGASVTATGFVVGDLAIYKDGSAIQKTSTNGLTVTTDFDSKTGLHLIAIDTSNDTGDAGFWVTGSDYLVAVDAVTVDGQSVRFWVGQFSIENRYMRGTDSAALASVATEARLAELDAANLPTDIDAILADTNELQTDDVPGLIATAQADLDIITGADGVNLLSATQASIDAIEADTNELQTDDIPGTLSTIAGYLDTEVTAILADTNELQTDWADGGRLDLILDARASQATADAIEADTQDIQSRLPAALVGGRMDCTVDGIGMEAGAIDAILQRQITESYNADGTAPTVEQALIGIFQCLTEFAIGGTTITVKKLDGSTAAMTFTLDDATNPTSRTRAT